MKKISDSTFQVNMKEILDKVCDNHQPVIITRSEGKPAVIMSLSDFKSYKETFYLMSSLANAQRINEAISEIEESIAIKHNLIE